MPPIVPRLQATATEPLLSDAVAAWITTLPLQLPAEVYTVEYDGQEMVGGVVSTVGVTVTCWLHWAVFPDVSEAVQPMACTPIPKMVLAATDGCRPEMPQLSAAVAWANWPATIPHPEALTDTFAGQVKVASTGHAMAGGSLSTTVTVQLHEALFPVASAAV